MTKEDFYCRFQKINWCNSWNEIPLLAGDSTLVGGAPVANFIYPRGLSKFYTSRNMMRFWTNFAKEGNPGFSSNKIKWEQYIPDENDFYPFMIIDNKKNLKMSSSNLTLKKLTNELFKDND